MCTFTGNKQKKAFKAFISYSLRHYMLVLRDFQLVLLRSFTIFFHLYIRIVFHILDRNLYILRLTVSNN